MTPAKIQCAEMRSQHGKISAWGTQLIEDAVRKMELALGTAAKACEEVRE